MSRFPKAPVAITLTGEEWVALLGRILGQPLSTHGARTYREAADKLGKQLLAAQKEMKS